MMLCVCLAAALQPLVCIAVPGTTVSLERFKTLESQMYCLWLVHSEVFFSAKNIGTPVEI